ncbi:TonB-linked SusC/RagA family outer membrane protein [Chitinophaga skermanii]|uniref:TonB-linked SusC/RagA family outer membrane protein n=1 Tax=Chitinophaga skermanii TaxID=331697 RepID=A0A327Q9L3_9BACT|nr:SusC/RagA family TonB-linked outer membrane protein [Chitinophaga skermanii]RAJ00498.1 TonB-linked SusC/RagA family outer membrane protein [Chitinophaga skermanii]
MQKTSLLPVANAPFYARCRRLLENNQTTLRFIMKVNVILAIIIALSGQLLLASTMKGQGKTNLAITFGAQEESLKSALSRMERLANIRFIYRQEQVANYKNISIPKASRSLGEQLELVFENTPLRYRVVNDHFIIYNAQTEATDHLPVPTEQRTAADNGAIHGKVVDSKGDVIIGATIHIAGTSFGTSSNANGEFSIKNLKAGEYTIVVSFIGFEKVTKQVKVDNNDVQLSIVLPEAVNPLNEVVVVAYDNQKRSSFTGSAATVKTAAFARSPRATLQENLQGNVAGVIASNGSGQPGATPNIRIRGIGSINAGSAPLYVVDGVPLAATSVSSLNSQDIESFTVLKDASAASLYGSRAANGVILITTKKGNAGKTVFNASSQFGFNKVTLTDKHYPLNTREMLELLREGWVNSGQPESTFKDEIASVGIDTTVDTDWFDVLTRNGAYQQYDLSASGGTDKTKFYVSGSYYTSKAALEGSDWKRYTGTFRLTNQATKNLSFNIGLQLSYRSMHTQPDEGSNGNPVRMYKRYQPWLRVFKEDGTYDLSYANNYNPLAIVRENFNLTSDYGAVGKAGAKYTLTDWLSLENQTSFDFNYNDQKIFYKAGIGTARSNGGEAYYNTYRVLNWVSTSILRANKQFGQHGVGAFIGYEAQKVTGSGNSAGVQNFLPNTTTLDNASIATGAGSNETMSALNSMFASANYNYKSRYYVSASVRRDGSSRFGNMRRFGTFWSVGASWNVGEETFMKAQSTISELRLRTSYGVNGNQDIDNFASRALYAGSDYDQKPGYVFSRYGNNLLTWEKNKPFNVGVDYGLWNNRVTGTVEYYIRKTSDLLLDMPISATNGATSIFTNVGAMENSGFEFEITTQNILAQENGFGWNTSLNFSTLKNRITALSSPYSGDSYNRYVGGDFYQYYLRGYAGVDQTNGDALWYTDATKTKTTNDYGKATQFNQGSALPKFFGGLTNTFTYKGIGFSFLLFYNYGNKVYDNWGSNSNSDGNKGFNATDKIPRYVYDHRWRTAGNQTDVPKMVYGGSQSGSSNYSSTRFMYDGDYIRLRDVSLTYDLPNYIVKQARMGGIRVYARASNLFTYMKDSRMNFDPEVGIEGKTDQNAPMYKTLLFGIDIKF